VTMSVAHEPIQPKVLIIEDEEKIRQAVADYLATEGFAPLEAADGPSGLTAFFDLRPAIVVLDLMLPGLGGIEVLRRIREKSRVPVVILTARNDETDRVLGLELGADDYVAKPFSLRELAARLRAVLRRSAAASEGADTPERPATTGAKPGDGAVIEVGPLRVDVERHEVTVAGQPVELTPTEFSILRVLVENPGKVFSRLQLLDAAFGTAYEGYERSIDTHISNLRRKIEDDPAHPEWILTVFGVGYKLADPRRRQTGGEKESRR